MRALSRAHAVFAVAAAADNRVLMFVHQHTYVGSSVQIRNAVEPYRNWASAKLGIDMADAILLRMSVPFHDAAAARLLDVQSSTTDLILQRVQERILSVEAVPGFVPLVQISNGSGTFCTGRRATARPA